MNDRPPYKDIASKIAHWQILQYIRIMCLCKQKLLYKRMGIVHAISNQLGQKQKAQVLFELYQSKRSIIMFLAVSSQHMIFLIHCAQHIAMNNLNFFSKSAI